MRDYAERLAGLSREYDAAEDAGDLTVRAAVYDELLRLGAWMGSDGEFRGEGGIPQCA